MEPDRLWPLLKDAARGVGVEVRVESLAGEGGWSSRGGLCRLGGRLVAFVDRKAAPLERCRQLARVLAGQNPEGVYLRPAVREFLQAEGLISGEEG